MKNLGPDSNLTPRTIFEDQHLIVLSKPAGLLSQGESTGDVNLVDLLRQAFGRNYVGLVHRLDRNTSGIMVVAKRSKSAERLSRALQEGTLQRWYLAWVLGRPETNSEKRFRWVDRLEKDERTNIVRVSPKGKESALQGRVLETRKCPAGSEISLIEFHLETGRSHQIRAQSGSRGHPLLGDGKYAGKWAREHSAASESVGAPRPLLHSWKIEFPHPMSKEILSFEDPLPKEMTTG